MQSTQFQILVTKYAYYSKVGKIPTNPQKQNQDSFIVAPKILGNFSKHLFGVADGHGQFGKEVSTIVKHTLPVFLAENLKSDSQNEALTKAFAQSNQEVLANIENIELSGSTCVMVFIDGQKIYTANVGDSRAIMCCISNKIIQGKAITRDHKPDEPDEATRILNQGGRIEPFKGIPIMII